MVFNLIQDFNGFVTCVGCGNGWSIICAYGVK